MLGMCMCVLLLQAGQTGAMEPMCVGCGVGSEDQVQEARTSGGQGGGHVGHQAGRDRLLEGTTLAFIALLHGITHREII